MMIVVSGELRRIEKNLRTGIEIRKVGGTLISTQIKVEKTFVALFFVCFPFYASQISAKSQVIRVYERVWRLTLKMHCLPTCSDG